MYIFPYIHAHIYSGNISHVYIHIYMENKTLLREKIGSVCPDSLCKGIQSLQPTIYIAGC